MIHAQRALGVATFIALVCLATSAHAGDAEAGKAIYDANCSSCHGATGKGDGVVATNLNPPPRDFSLGEFKLDANSSGTPGEDEDLQLVIQKGAMSYGGSLLMAAWPLSDEEVADVIAYIRSLEKQDSP